MNSIVQVRQISQYPDKDPVFPDDRVVIQEGGLGGPYRSATVANLVATALMLPNENGATLDLELAPGQGLNWEGFPDARFWFGAINDDRFFFGRDVVMPALEVGALSINGHMAATVEDINGFAANVVTSFNGRVGGVVLSDEDVRRAGGAPIWNAHFGGWITAPTPWDTRINDDTVATTAWVHKAIFETGVASFNGRTGCVTLTIDDVNAAYAAAPPGVYPTAPSPALGDASSRIATTLFVDDSLADLHLVISNEQLALLTTTYAPLDSPQFVGAPAAVTASPGTSTGQLATTAFVMHAVTAGTAGVSSFNTRTGAVVLSAADVVAAGGAPSVSPALTGTPTAPTATPGNSTTQIATTAFVAAAILAAATGVSSFNARTGAVVLTLADVTGTGVLTSPALAGTPTAPTAAPGTATTQLATTAFVVANSVTSFMSRTGAVTLTSADVSAAGGALNASPVFTGTPAAPTPVPGDNSTKLATTAFVAAALSASGAGVSSVTAGAGLTGGGTGAVTLSIPAGGVAISMLASVATATLLGRSAAGAGPVSAQPAATVMTMLGAAPLVSPTFTGVPAAPTAAVGTSTTQLATTGFVAAGFLPLAGGTLTGNMQVSGSSFPTFTVNKTVAGTSALFTGTFNGLQRWSLSVGDSTAESGSNVGSDFDVNSYSDAGAYLSTPLNIKRSTGVATFSVAIVNGPSDRSLKENIRPLESALDKVRALQGVSFNMIGESPGRRQIGLIAQDVQSVVPEVIQDYHVSDGDMKLALDYPKLVALLIEAIKELSARLEKIS